MKEGKVKKPFYKKWWFFLIVAIVVIGGISSMGDEGKDVSDTGTQKPVEENEQAEGEEVTAEESQDESPEEPEEVAEINISAPELVQAFEENEVKANQDYKGKTAEVSGTVKSIGESFGTPYIVLNSGEEFAITEVQCMFKDEDEIAKVAEIAKGSDVVIEGKIGGKSMNITVSDCKLK